MIQGHKGTIFPHPKEQSPQVMKAQSDPGIASQTDECLPQANRLCFTPVPQIPGYFPRATLQTIPGKEGGPGNGLGDEILPQWHINADQGEGRWDFHPLPGSCLASNHSVGRWEPLSSLKIAILLVQKDGECKYKYRYKQRIKALALLRMKQCKEKSLPISGWLCLKMKNHCKNPPNPFWQQFPPSWGWGTSRVCNKLPVVAFWTNEFIFTSPGGIQKSSRQPFVVEIRD